MSSNLQIFETSRTQFGKNIKMDTNLETMNPKNFSEASDLSSISSGTVPSERFGCQHKKLVTQENYDTCFHCGAFVPKNGNKVFKSGRMNYLASFPPKTIYRAMTKRSNYFRQSFNPEYSKVRQIYVEWILEIAEKLKISNHTVHLAVHLLDVIMYKDSSLTPHLQLYAPVCLLIAAKTIELDERIPYIPHLKKVTNSSISIETYRKAELFVLDFLGWNPQYSSALEITEFFLCQGVLFSNDEIEDQSQENEQEPLRENTQHSNLNSTRSLKRNAGTKSLKDLLVEKGSSHKKNNHENILFDNVTATLNTQPPLGEEDLPSSRGIPYFLKQNSLSPQMTARDHQQTPQKRVVIQRHVEDIVRHLEANYSKLLLLILKDIDFIQWDQQTIAAASVAFLRYLNRIVFLWNSELESVTQLTFSQVSSCFAMINKKFSAVFSFHKLKSENILYHVENMREINCDLKLIMQPPTINAPIKNQKPVAKLEFNNLAFKENTLHPPRQQSTTTLNPSSSRQELSIFDNNKNKQQERKTIFRNPSKTTLHSTATLAVPYDNIWENFNSTMFSLETSNAENIPKRNMIFSTTTDKFGGDYSRVYSQTQPLNLEAAGNMKPNETASHLQPVIKPILTARNENSSNGAGENTLTKLISSHWDNIVSYARRK